MTEKLITAKDAAVNESLKDKKLVIFDLDGTLAESKANMDSEMAGLLAELLEKKMVAVIGGGGYPQFEKQFIVSLQMPEKFLERLFLFPTTSTSFYKYQNGRWQKIYEHLLRGEEKLEIFSAFEKTFKDLNYKRPEKIYGEVIEDRGTQVTFSALGQKAPLEAKERWKKENTETKMKIAETLQKYLPGLEVRAAGYTSIDVTRKGIDKAYGISQIEENLGIPKTDMIFVGDALFPGGNDYAALKTGVICISVSGPSETKEVIRSIL